MVSLARSMPAFRDGGMMRHHHHWRTTMRTSLVSAAFLALSFSVSATAQHATVAPDAVKWGPGPAAYAPGAQMAVISGDPSKEGFYVVRLKLPAGFKIAPHVHPNEENVTVLSGSFNIG